MAAMTAVAAGDDTAFRPVVDALAMRLQRFFERRGVAAAEAEDLVQETLIRLYRKRASYRPGSSVAAWAFVIGRNLMIDRHRRQRPQVALEDAGQLVAPPEPEVAGTGDIWALAQRTLKPREFEALWLRYEEDLGVPEVARILGVTGVHARVLLHRARSRLAHVLQKEAPI